MCFTLLSSPTRLGMDIQPDKIRLLRLRVGRRRRVIEQRYEVDLPAGIMADGKVRQWDRLTEVLRKLVQQTGNQGSAVTIGIPCQLVRLTHHVLPMGMSSVKILSMLRSEVMRELPGMTDALILDYALLGKSADGYDQIVSVVAREEYVLQYARAVNASGVIVKRVEVDVFAMQRVFAKCLSPAVLLGLHALIYEVNHVVTCLVYQSSVLIYYQSVKLSEREIFQQVINRQLAVATSGAFKAVIVGSVHHDVIEDQIEINKHTDFQLIKLRMAQMANNARGVSVMSDADWLPYLYAAGYALQAVPRW